MKDIIPKLIIGGAIVWAMVEYSVQPQIVVVNTEQPEKSKIIETEIPETIIPTYENPKIIKTSKNNMI